MLDLQYNSNNIANLIYILIENKYKFSSTFTQEQFYNYKRYINMVNNYRIIEKSQNSTYRICNS